MPERNHSKFVGGKLRSRSDQGACAFVTDVTRTIHLEGEARTYPLAALYGEATAGMAKRVAAAAAAVG